MQEKKEGAVDASLGRSNIAGTCNPSSSDLRSLLLNERHDLQPAHLKTAHTLALTRITVDIILPGLSISLRSDHRLLSKAKKQLLLYDPDLPQMRRNQTISQTQ